MSNGWAFALGWIGCNAFIAWGMPSPFQAIGALLRATAATYKARQPLRWEIGGTTWYARPLTRAVMEQVAAVQHNDIPVMVGFPFMTAPSSDDREELLTARKQSQADAIRAAYEICATLLIDEDGNPPEVEMLSDELTINEVQRNNDAVINR